MNGEETKAVTALRLFATVAIVCAVVGALGYLFSHSGPQRLVNISSVKPDKERHKAPDFALKDADGKPVTETKDMKEQVLPMGPAASQIAIKQWGTNGGGFFNVNSAHPFENPTPLTNFIEMLAILLIAAALCYTFCVMVGDTRQGWAVLAAMTLVWVALLAL